MHIYTHTCILLSSIDLNKFVKKKKKRLTFFLLGAINQCMAAAGRGGEWGKEG